MDYQVRGELPIQSCKAVLERVNFLDNPSKEELASCFADVVTQIAQDVGLSNPFFQDLKPNSFDIFSLQNDCLLLCFL